MVQAVSSHSVIGGRRGRRETFFTIPSEDWQHADERDLLWISGDFDFQSIEEESAFRSTVTTRHFGVKFDPQGIGNIIGAGSDPRPPPDLPPAPEPESEPQSPDTKGPRVSDAHLRAWFEFYKAVHSTAEDTEERAVVFARHCFPGKSVSRDRIRALRGSVKRGPKPGGT
jgi:hypothetical protein